MDNTLYLIEGYNSASIAASGCLSLEVYKQQITITQIRTLIKQYHLKERKRFKDIVDFSNKNLAIQVILKDEEEFYDDKETKVKNLSFYLLLVDSIEITLLRQLDSKDLEIIEKIMKTFNLNVYHIDTRTRCTNINEVKELLVKIGF